MDLQLAFRVLWRFRVIVAVGLAFGILLAVLAMARVSLTSSPHFAYRTQPQYVSTSTVFVTTHGFPWGSLTLNAGGRSANTPRGVVNTGNLRDAASLYLNLATSNQVMAYMRRSGPVHGQIESFPIVSADSTTLPLIGLNAIASSKQGADELAKRHLAAFQGWLENNQEQAGIPPANRIVLQPVTGPLPATLLRGRRMTKPILIFMAIAVVTVGLAFLLENMRPRIRAVPSEDEHVDEARATRLTA